MDNNFKRDNTSNGKILRRGILLPTERNFDKSFIINVTSRTVNSNTRNGMIQ